jgi:hypothetical protein
MIPLLIYPLALIGLATLPALVAIYILRNRFHRRTVSSLVLWQFHVQSKAGGAKVHRLQLPRLFFLEFLALALLVAAAAAPQWKMPQTTRPLIVVLDDSFSMRATSNGSSAQARARDFLEHLVSGHPPPSTRFILAGTRAYSLDASAASWPQMADILRQWRCWCATATIDSAITLAEELGRNQANILILTDHKPPADKITNRRIEWRAFGEALDNFAIVNATRTAFGDQDRCLLEVANFSAEPRTVHLLVEGGANTLQNSLLSIGARASNRVVFNIPESTPLLRAAIDPAPSDIDALDLDNQVQLLPPIRRRVRVEVALVDKDLQSLVNRTLDATGLRSSISSDPELIIEQSDKAAPSDCWRLRWIGSDAKNAFDGPFVIDTSHPLAKGLGLQGVVWAGAQVAEAPGDVPVILAGNSPLLSVRQDIHGGRLLTLNFNPRLSTVQDTPDWPILLWNLLQWRADEMPGLKEANVRLGPGVQLKTIGDSVIITSPDHATRSYSATGGELALETPMPGIYSVSMGATASQFSANPLSADESDLSTCATGQWGAWDESTEFRLEETSAAWILGLLALALLAGHLFLLSGAKGGGR